MMIIQVLCVFMSFCVLSSSTSWLDRLDFSDAYNGEELEDFEDQPMFPQDKVVLAVLRDPDYQDRVVQVYNPEPENEHVVDSGVENTVQTLAKKVDNLLGEVKSQREKIKELDTVNKKLLYKIDELEQQTKVNNLIFSNVHESKHENTKATLQKVLYIINRIMKVRTTSDDIAVALRMDNTGLNQSRPIVVRFANFASKMKVLGARNKLKKSLINVTSEYSELVSQRRKELLPFLIEKRRLGHIAFMIYDKLMVDGEKMTLEDLQAERRQGGGVTEMTVVEEPEEEILPEEPDEQVEELEVQPLGDYED